VRVTVGVERGGGKGELVCLRNVGFWVVANRGSHWERRYLLAEGRISGGAQSRWGGKGNSASSKKGV